MLVFDCETRTDKAQALTFGSYRFLVEGRCLEEGLFYGDDLMPRELAVLERYVARHAADTDPRGIPERDIPSDPQLRLLPRRVPHAALPRGVQGARRCSLRSTSHLISRASRWAIAPRMAASWAASRFQFFQYRDPAGNLRPNPYRPAIAVKHMDSKRALKRFTGDDRSR